MKQPPTVNHNRFMLVNSVPVSVSSDHGSRESNTDTVDWEEVVAQDVHAEVVVEPELPVPDFPGGRHENRIQIIGCSSVGRCFRLKGK